MRRTKWRAVPIFLATAVLALGVVACGDDDDSGGGGGGGTKSSAEGGKEKVKTAILLPCATSDPWCKQGYDAAKKLEADGEVELKVTTNGPQDTPAVTRVLSQYARRATSSCWRTPRSRMRPSRLPSSSRTSTSPRTPSS
jgi:basic membrane protein A